MAFDDLRGELFGKLGVDPTTDPLELIEQGEAEITLGNKQKGAKLFEQAILISQTRSDKYQEQNQHRAAAESLYIQALAYEKLDQKDKRQQIYNSVVDELLSASKNAIAFGEENRGFASATLASMVCLMNNDKKRAFQIYDEHISLSEQKSNPEFLKKLLFSIGYLLDALENDNVSALTDAQNFISTDLRPMLGTAKLAGFEKLLNKVVLHTQQVLEKKIKMPDVRISTSIPRDIQFNKIFKLSIDMKNEGEGDATSLTLQMEIPDELEIVDGRTDIQVESLGSDQQLTHEVSLRFLTGETLDPQMREVKGEITYTDMRGDGHKQFFGPLSIEFTAISKKSEFETLLRNLINEIPTTLESVYGQIPLQIVNNYFQLLKSFEPRILEKIQQEEFDQVEFGLSILESSINWGKQLQTKSDLSVSIDNEIQTKIESEKSQFEVMITENLTRERETEISNLKQVHEDQMRNKITDLRDQLFQDYELSTNEMRENHEKQMQQVQLSNENRLKQQLVQLENKLKEESRKELDQKNEEIETVIRELQDRERENLEKAKTEAKNEVSGKLNLRIKELEDSLEELKRQLTTRHEEEKKLELNTLRQKLGLEKTEALELQERQLREKFKLEYGISE